MSIWHSMALKEEHCQKWHLNSLNRLQSERKKSSVELVAVTVNGGSEEIKQRRRTLYTISILFIRLMSRDDSIV